VGEDRTGALAGQWLLLEKHAEGKFISTQEVFRKEMCARGYSDGTTHKPGKVTEAISF